MCLDPNDLDSVWISVILEPNPNYINSDRQQCKMTQIVMDPTIMMTKPAWTVNSTYWSAGTNVAGAGGASVDHESPGDGAKWKDSDLRERDLLLLWRQQLEVGGGGQLISRVVSKMLCKT